ncbi:ImmA/IrrE family metallo-endopeptidase [Virgibacillus sp. CBA3643]|uniref:ImmA/IrrE family metallo-endopeptidase n=1 Tax=Virgibacillus sp. CBA3643 TaxID=2942278 RepID=UPI0035A3CC9C
MYTERYIEYHLKLFNLNEPEDLSIEGVSNIINLTVKYWEFTSEAAYYKGNYIIILNENLNEQQQWQEFAHELCHVLWHVGRQDNLTETFIQPQEWQAGNFAYNLCVPTFMLERMQEINIHAVMNTFNVGYEFAFNRLEMYERKMIDAGVNNKEREQVLVCD